MRKLMAAAAIPVMSWRKEGEEEERRGGIGERKGRWDGGEGEGEEGRERRDERRLVKGRRDH